MKKIKNSKLLMQILKFGLVGGVAFLIDYGILIICKEVIGLSILLSAAIAFSISVIFNYILSVIWIFDVDKEKSSKKNFIIFVTLSIVGLAITELIMDIGSNKLNINYLIVKILATTIVMVFNFITRKMFLEKRK